MITCNRCGKFVQNGLAICQNCGEPVEVWPVSSPMGSGGNPRTVAPKQPELPAWLETLRAEDRPVPSAQPNFPVADLIEEGTFPSWMRPENGVWHMVPPSVYCDICGTPNRAEARFCFTCGQPLQATSSHLMAPTVLINSPVGVASSPLLKQRYSFVANLGKGGMGAVYKAADTQFGNRIVAIKETNQSGLSPEDMKIATEAFRREALLLAGLVHPNLPRIYDHFTEAGHWYLVMDFIEGETLAEYLSKASGGRLAAEEVLDIGIQVCTVLNYLHNRQPPIIFRDLKPSNVMRTPDSHLYLIDFGIARHFKPEQTKDTHSFVSHGYAAPEQYGQTQTTPRSDIYSLGATLHQLLSGNNPAQTPFRFAPLRLGIAALETLILQMVDIDADKRPASMAVIKQELQWIAAQDNANHLAVPDKSSSSPNNSLIDRDALPAWLGMLREADSPPPARLPQSQGSANPQRYPQESKIICPRCGNEWDASKSPCTRCGLVVSLPAKAEAKAKIGILRVKEGKESGRIYELRKDSMSIGKSRESDIFLADLAVSRLHASILRMEDGNYALRDEGSANGTKVNGQQVNKFQNYPLQAGDRIEFGQHILVFDKR